MTTLFEDERTHFATLPGKVISMLTFQGTLFVAYEIERRWWQFWLPKKRTEISTFSQ